MTTATLDERLQRRESLALRLAAAPERTVQVAVALALAAGITVSFGQFRWWITLPLAFLIIAGTWRAFRPRVTVADARPAVWLLGGTVVWTALNAILTSEYLIVVRDPGFLTLSGLWLVDHPSTDIPTGGAIEAAAAQDNMLADAWQAWNLRGDMIQPQGAKMMPATIAMGGWLLGDFGVLVANLLVGAVGILAVYALARQFVGSRLALAPAAGIALTVAHIALSRSAYSEPLTLVLVIAGVLWAWRGVRERSTALVVAGALATGATVLIRIDGAIFAAGAMVGIVVALALSDAPRRWRIGTALLALGAQAGAVAGGYASLWRWSESYIERLAGQADSLTTAYTAVAVLLAVWIAAWAAPLRADRVLTAPAQALGKRGAYGVGAVVLGGLLVLASRPLWVTVHRGTETTEDQFTNSVVESFQAGQGLEIDPTRTYAESTVTWVSHYLTWPVVLLAFVGLAIASARMLRGRPEWAIVLGATLAPSLLYFWTPEIVPDQIWAIRRFEPMTLPAFAIAAMVGAMALVKRLPEHQRARGKTWAFALVALLPIATWPSIVPGDDYPVLGATPLVVKEMGGARAQLDELCAVAPGHPIVLASTSSHFGSLRVMCDEPVVLALVQPTPEALVEMTEAFGKAPVVLTRDTTWFTWMDEPSVVVNSTVRQAGYAIGRIPRTYNDRTYDWYAGLVQPDGSLAPIESQG